MSFNEKYGEYKRIVGDALCGVPGGADSPLNEVIRYSLNAGGKRIRPVLVLAFCEAYGGDVQKALPVAAAIEILHTSTLIQDDLPCMDDDDLRRGKPACHKAFSEADAVLTASKMAFDAIQMPGDVRIIKTICRYMSLVYDGQKLDLMNAPNTLEICELKTCALIQAACVAGVMTAQGGEAAEENAADYAYNLGLAFQLIDDILDDEGCETAKEDAEKYTREALRKLENVPGNGFLKELTENLLDRKN
jgi:geranylgeranyl diphosphate synthase type II